MPPLVGLVSSKSGTDDHTMFLESNGYEMWATVKNHKRLAWDYIFVEKGFKKDVKLENIESRGITYEEPKTD